MSGSPETGRELVQPVVAAPPRGASVGTFAALVGLVLRMQVTPLRIAGIGALGALAIGLGALTRGDDDPVRATTEVAIGYGLGILVPLATVWLATSMTGDLVDDRLLVYLWLKPVPRWQLPGAAIVATVVVIVPLAGLPLAATALVAGTPELLGSVLLAALLAVPAYAAVFVAAGLWLRRALWWSLLYVLVWENGLARAVDGAARLSIASYAQSLVADAADVSIAYADRRPLVALVVLPAVALVGFALATIRYRRGEVD